MTAGGTPAQGQGRERVFDSPTGWVAEHVRSYVETGGEKGHLYHGMPTLLLTTRGRKSDKLRRPALIYGRDCDPTCSWPRTAGRRATPRGTSTWHRSKEGRQRFWISTPRSILRPMPPRATGL